MILASTTIASVGCDSLVHLGDFAPDTAYEICNRASGKCLDIQDATTEVGAPLVQWTLSRTTASQGWTMVEKFPGEYKFVNVATALCAEAANGVYNGSVNGGRLQQDTCAGSEAHQPDVVIHVDPRWLLQDRSVTFEDGPDDGSINLPSGSLSADGAATVQNRWNGSASQQWSIAPRSTSALVAPRRRRGV